jgi:nitrite reductase/ring-hydroxylating ferredoxin subunit
MSASNFVFAADLAEVEEVGIKTVQRGGHTIVLVRNNGAIYAVDNRCPHMGFPLDRGTVKDGILTCHWHHARFDLASGGTFDQWADDIRAFPVELRDGEVWVDLQEHRDLRAHQRDRLRVGLERDIPLVIGKAVLTLTEGDGDPVAPFRTGLEFGARYRNRGWGQGLTMHVCFMNMLPHLEETERPRALYHGLSAVARDSFDHPARFCVRPLPGATPDLATLKRWFRQFIEVRDDEGAERCIVSALRAGATPAQMADMLFTAVTDHRYIDIGHPADFTNKALEALDIAGWDLAELVLTSLVRGYAMAERMEESNAWRHPIDLVALLEGAFEELPEAVADGGHAGEPDVAAGRPALVELLLGDDPQVTVDAMLAALRAGMSGVELAQTVAYAAALRIARFHTSNEFGDWDTALHTFTFANAVHQGVRRAPSVDLLRGVFDAAMSVYLDRFLNIPAARVPEANGHHAAGDGALDELSLLLDRQQQVNQSAAVLAGYAYGGGDGSALLARLGALLLREDRDFHTVQCVEAAFRQHALLADNPTAQTRVLVAAMRYLAAHAPTVRAQGQTYRIASRLHRGEELFEG